MLGIVLLLDRKNMPSLRKAYDLWLYDRPLFWQRLKANLNRGTHSPLSFLRGNASLQQDILLASPLCTEKARCLVVFSCNPLLPSGVATAVRTQCRLLRDMGYALDALVYAMDGCSREDAEVLQRHFERTAVIYPRTARQERLADGVTAPNLDTWCGSELLDACALLLEDGRYCGVIVHQPWLSRVLACVPKGIKKYLFMHDNFAGRAALFERQGLPARSAWLNLEEAEQARCMKRADIIFAIQDEEKALYERQLCSQRQVVIFKIPFPDNTRLPLPRVHDKLAVGVLASDNESNRHAVGDFLIRWERESRLHGCTELHIAGDVCNFIKSRDPSVHLLGRVENLERFYADLHLVINPDFSGTGIKIKSLEALSYGRPLLCGGAGSRGLNAVHPWHALPGRASMLDCIVTLTQRKEMLPPLREESIRLFYEYSRMDTYRAALEGMRRQADGSAGDMPPGKAPVPFFFDAAPLALWEQSDIHKTGIGRMATRALRAFVRREDIRVLLISPSGMENDVRRFLEHNPWARNASLLHLALSKNPSGSWHGKKLKPAIRRILAPLPSRVQGWLKQAAGVRPFALYDQPCEALRQAILPHMTAGGKAVWFSCFQPVPHEVSAMPGIRSCVVLHDIIPLRLRDKHPFYGPCLDLMRQHLRKADIIWANSQFTRQDFLSFFPGADGDKVRVALLGGGDHFHAADGGQTESVLRALGIPAHTPFFVSLATVEPRKGLTCVIRAFRRLVEKYPDAHLLLVGQKGWNCGGIVRECAETRQIHLTGFLPDEAVAALLSGRRAFLYLSEYEGFGLPVLEAMSCGAPVIAANRTSLPEIGGDAALYVPPSDVEALAARMVELLEHEVLQKTLRRKGLARSAAFTWDAFAQTVVDGMVYGTLRNGSGTRTEKQH